MTEPRSQLLTRVGIIGDPHAEDNLLVEAIRFLRGEGIETILCTGDVVDGQGDADRCCELLESENILTVRGNHDRWYLGRESLPRPVLTTRSRLFLRDLPPMRRLDTPSGPLLLCHGLGIDDMAVFFPDDTEEAIASSLPLQSLLSEDYRYVVSGHTHARMSRAVGRTTFLNAGTLMWGYEQGFLLADFAEGAVAIYGFDESGHAIPTGALTLP